MSAIAVSEPASLFAVRATLNCPGSLKECVGAEPLAVVPSPKLQRRLSGSPVDWSKNCSVSPTSTVLLANEKSAVGTRKRSGATTVKSNDWLASSPASFDTKRVTVKTPSCSHAFSTTGPLAPVPSPKSQFQEVGPPVDESESCTISPALIVSDEKLKFASNSSTVGSSTTCASASRMTGADESSPSKTCSASSASRPSPAACPSPPGAPSPPSPTAIPVSPNPNSPSRPKMISSVTASPAAASTPSPSPCSAPPTRTVLIFEMTLISSPRSTAASDPRGSFAHTVPSKTSSSKGRPATPKRISSSTTLSSRSTTMICPSA